MNKHIETMTSAQQTAFAESYAGCMADYEASLIPKDAPEHYPKPTGYADRLASGEAKLAAGQKLLPGDAVPLELFEDPDAAKKRTR